MRTAVREMVGDVDSVQFTDSQLLLYLNWGAREISRRLELQTTDASFASLNAPGELVGGVELAAGFYREISVRWNGLRLQQIPYSEFYPAYEAVVTGTGTPTHYAITPPNTGTGTERRLLLYPYQTIGLAGTLTVQFIGRPVDMVAAGDTCLLPEDLHEVVVIYACSLVKQSESDNEGFQMFRSDFNQRLTAYSALQINADAFSNPQVREDAPTIYYFDR